MHIKGIKQRQVTHSVTQRDLDRLERLAHANLMNKEKDEALHLGWSYPKHK